MKTFEKKIATSLQTRDKRGFALIELLTAVATIAVLIGLLLPAIQWKRERGLAEEMTEELHAATAAAKYYRSLRGEFPQSLAQLVQFVTANPSAGISIDPRLASGRINGHLCEIVEADQDHCIIEAEPEFPGITGSQTVRASTSTLTDTLISGFVTPGSDEAREEMFNRIRLKAAETVVTLLASHYAAWEINGLVREQIESNFIANVMDTDADGRTTIDEIRNYDDPNMDSALKGPLSEFIDYVAREMKWDSLSEQESQNTAAVTTELEEFANAAHVPPLFSYDGLSVLTITAITDGTSNTLLISELKAAEAADAAGDQKGKSKAIKNYQKQVKAQIGQTLTRTNAKTLITMSSTL